MAASAELFHYSVPHLDLRVCQRSHHRQYPGPDRFPAGFRRSLLVLLPPDVPNGGQPATLSPRSHGGLRVHIDTHRSGVQLRPFLELSADSRPANNRPGVGPLRLRLGPVRHRRLPHRRTDNQRPVYLVLLGGGDRSGGHYCGLPGPPPGHAHLPRPDPGYEKPDSYAGPDGALHRGQPVDCLPPHHPVARLVVQGPLNPSAISMRRLSAQGRDAPSWQYRSLSLVYGISSWPETPNEVAEFAAGYGGLVHSRERV